MNTPKLYMLIGLPGSGKSTFINKILNPNKDWYTIVLSTDASIERYAEAHGKTYDDVFQEAIKGAETYLNDKLDHAIEHEYSIIWDQTNLTRKSRARKLAKIREYYYKIAMVVETDEEKRLDGLNQRFGTTIR